MHPCCCKWHYFIIFYGWVVFHCIYVPHLLYPFIWHLGSFYVLAIVDIAPMNIGVHVSFWIMVLSWYMPRSGIAGLYVNFIFSFLRNLRKPTYILTNSVGVFPFLHTLSSICYINCFITIFFLGVHWKKKKRFPTLQPN